MIQALAVQTPTPAAPPVVNEDGTEPFLTLEEISKRWNVSTKTIRRWGKLGLVGRKVTVQGPASTGVQAIGGRPLSDRPP